MHVTLPRLPAFFPRLKCTLLSAGLRPLSGNLRKFSPGWKRMAITCSWREYIRAAVSRNFWHRGRLLFPGCPLKEQLKLEAVKNRRSEPLLIPPGNISQSQAVCLTKIPLKQPLESFAMSGLIPCHLMRRYALCQRIRKG